MGNIKWKQYLAKNPFLGIATEKKIHTNVSCLQISKKSAKIHICEMVSDFSNIEMDCLVLNVTDQIMGQIEMLLDGTNIGNVAYDIHMSHISTTTYQKFLHQWNGLKIGIGEMVNELEGAAITSMPIDGIYYNGDAEYSTYNPKSSNIFNPIFENSSHIYQ